MAQTLEIERALTRRRSPFQGDTGQATRSGELPNPTSYQRDAQQFQPSLCPDTPVEHKSTSSSVVAPLRITPIPGTLGLSQGCFSSTRDGSCGRYYLPVPLQRQTMLAASGRGYRHPCPGLETPIQRQAL